MSTSQNIWFITGASAGLGKSFAQAAASRGQLVIATARNIDSIKDLQSPSIKILQLDVTNPPADLAAQSKEYFGRAPNILLNNAGFGLAGPVEELSSSDLQYQFDTNCFGLLATQNLLLPGIRSYGKKGWVLSVSSWGAWDVRLFFSAYQASKHALRSFSRALAIELQPFETNVVALEVGSTLTGFFLKGDTPGRPAGFQVTKNNMEEYREAKAQKISSFSDHGPAARGDPRKVANRVVDLVLGEGGAKGRKIPAEVALGGDSVDIIRNVLKTKLAELEEWEEFSRDVDREDA